MLSDFWETLWLIKHTLTLKRKPKSSKWKIQQLHPNLTQLERREVYSYQPWVYQPIYAMGGASSFDQLPWYGQLGETIQPPLNALSGVPDVGAPGGYLSQFTLSGVFDFDMYSYATYEAGGSGGGLGGGTGGGPHGGITWALYEESGVVTFTSGPGLYQATINATWLYDDSSGFGTTGSINDTFTFDFNLENWVQIPQSSYAFEGTTFTFNEEGTLNSEFLETATLSVQAGFAVSGEEGVPSGMARPPFDLMQEMPGVGQGSTDSMSYGFLGIGLATFQSQGTGSFTLLNMGSTSSIGFSLTSINYNSSGVDTFSFDDQGTDTAAFVGVATTSYARNSGTETGTALQHTNFETADVGSFGYSESGSYDYIEHISGYDNVTPAPSGSMSFDSVMFDASGNILGEFGVSGTGHFTTTMGASDVTGGGVFNEDPMGYGQVSSTNTNFGSSGEVDTGYGVSAFAVGETVTASFSFYQAGSFTDGAYNFGTVIYDAAGTLNTSLSNSSTETFSGSGSSTYGGSDNGFGVSNDLGSENGAQTFGSSGSSSYSTELVLSNSDSETETAAYALHASGNDIGGCISLGCVTLSETDAVAETVTNSASETFTGSGNSSESGTMNQSAATNFSDTTNNLVGQGTMSASENYSFVYNINSTNTDASALTYNITLQGEFEGGSYSLGCVAVTDSGVIIHDDTWNEHGSYSGSGSEQDSYSYGNHGGGTVNYYSSLGTTSGGSSDSVSYSYSGAFSSTYGVDASVSVTNSYYGQFSMVTIDGHAEGCLTFGTVTIENQATTTVTESDEDNYTISGTEVSTSNYSGSDNSSILMPAMSSSGSQSMSNSSSDAFSYSATVTESFSAIEVDSITAIATAGSYNGLTYSFGSVTIAESASATVVDAITANTSVSGSGAETYSASGAGGYSGVQGNLSSGGTSSTSLSGDDHYSFSAQEAFSESESAHAAATLAETGSWTDQGYTFGSVVYSDSAHASWTLSDSVTETFSANGQMAQSTGESSSGSSSSGLDSGTNGSASSNESDFGSYSVSGVIHSSDNATAAATTSFYESGNYSNGSYAFGSLAYSESAAASDDASAGGTVIDSEFASVTITENSGGSQAQAYGSSGSGTVQATDSLTETGTSNSTTTFTFSGVDDSRGTVSLSEQGSFSNSSFSLSSVVYQDSAAETWSLTAGVDESETDNISVSDNSTSTVSNGLASGGSGLAAGGLQSENGVYGCSYSGSSNVAINDSGNVAASDYQAGQFSNGSFSYSSIVHTESGNDSASISVELHDSTEQTFDGTITTSGQSAFTWGSGSEQDGSGSETLAGHFDDTVAETLSLSVSGQDNYSLYESGAFSAGSLSLGSVLYSDGSIGSYSVNHTSSEEASGYGIDNSSSQGTLTDGGQTGTSKTSSTDSFTYLITSAVSVTASGSGSSTDTESGVYSAGCFVFSTYIHDEQAQDTNSAASAETLSWSSSGTRFSDDEGISTGGVNGTFTYSATSNMAESATVNATDSYSLHESGSNTDGAFNLSCMNYNASASETVSVSAGGNDSMSDGTGFTANDTYSGSETVTDSASAAEQGTYSGESWNVSNGSNQENAIDNSNFNETVAQSATGQSSLATLTESSSATFSEYEPYQYGNNSFSFGSLSLSDQATGSSAYQETGSNASFSSYVESDGDNSSYNLQVTGSGQVGSYTESSLETITHTFDGTYTGGGAIHESSLATTGYTNSGTISLSTGNTYIANAIDLAAPMPPSLPSHNDPRVPAGMLVPPIGFGGPSGAGGSAKNDSRGHPLTSGGNGGASGGGFKSSSNVTAGSGGSKTAPGGTSGAPGFTTFINDGGFAFCTTEDPMQMDKDAFEAWLLTIPDNDGYRSYLRGQWEEHQRNKNIPIGIQIDVVPHQARNAQEVLQVLLTLGLAAPLQEYDKDPAIFFSKVYAILNRSDKSLEVINLQEMMAKIKEYIEKRKASEGRQVQITRFVFRSHGNSSGIRIGFGGDAGTGRGGTEFLTSDMMDPDNPAHSDEVLKLLAQLGEMMGPDGVIVVWACNCANSDRLLQLLANATHRTVRGFTGGTGAAFNPLSNEQWKTFKPEKQGK